MALNVTFTSVTPNRLPIEVAEDTDTEQIAVGASSTQGTKLASTSRRVVSLLAEEDCWIMVGPSPTAVALSGRKLLANERFQLWCNTGEKVAVIQV